jgi:hypothetical protein
MVEVFSNDAARLARERVEAAFKTVMSSDVSQGDRDFAGDWLFRIGCLKRGWRIQPPQSP